ncbi:hypothetical protein PHJA_000903300 [Phtheirospermum japonicum]|uniref:Uncharacterized protein n=1 Tax=Phtheirospermum japonicum TaxID=374723 RepID=A0A830BLE6_9LAMI|nr:hypothetical protein PHJA_000903300 [Phtheirospermum japonicum]
MLKQSPNRNIRAKSLKVKHALQILLLVISIWLIYQVNKTYTNKVALEAEKVSENGEAEYQILKIGRKHLKPRVEKRVDEEDEEIIKVREIDGDEGIERDEEIDSADKEKSEEGEHDQLQEFIDEDDKDAQEK